MLDLVLPLASGALSLVFAISLLRRYSVRKGAHLLLWSIGMILYAAGGFCEAYQGAFGWNPWVFRVWYLCGAVLSAAWLGQGTVNFLVKRPVAYVLLSLLAAGSVYAVVRVLGAELDPSLLTAGRLGGRAIVTRGVRSLTPVFNIYGTFALVGGAAWSALIFLRKQIFPHRVIGNILIAVGALLPAVGGSLSRFGAGSLLYASELAGALLMFAGFLRTTTPLRGDRAGPDSPSERGGTR